MKAVVIESARRADLVELETPRPGPEEVLVRSYAAGICGSDAEIYHGTRPEGFVRYPVVPGHEWAGEVAEVGERVRGLAPGDRVVTEGYLSCGVCRSCRGGSTTLCEAGYDEIGFTQAGGFAEYVVVPAHLVHRLPAGASLEEAAVLEPAAVVAHAFLRAQPKPGDVVAVVGDGTIGLLGVQLARLFSPSAIAVTGTLPDRLDLARKFGASHTVDVAKDDPLAVVRSLTRGQGADYVFEGAGHASAVEQALRLARPGGTVALEGLAGEGARISVGSDLFVLNHLSVLGVRGANSAAWAYAVGLFRAGLLRLGDLITHRFELGRYQEALDTMMSRKPGTMKVLVTHHQERSR